MAHCPYDQLTDLAEALAEIRTWLGIREPKPGVFYVKRKPFLHFHLQDGRRWADARCGSDWGRPIEAPTPSTAATRKKFLATAKRYYRHTAGMI